MIKKESLFKKRDNIQNQLEEVNKKIKERNNDLEDIYLRLQRKRNVLYALRGVLNREATEIERIEKEIEVLMKKE
jgi:septal ring factor EnvC (AmiA/AmiB activator)